MSISSLAAALGVSYQAIKKLHNGTSKAFSAENNSKAATILGVSPDWLATGDGEMLPVTPPALIGKPATDAATTLVQALEVVAQALQGADELSRIQAKPLIQHLMEHPEQAANITHRLAALLNRSGLPPAQTSDFAAPAPTHHFQKTPNGA